jgi:Ni,Fe-hydrogenase maturation factor
MWNMHTLNLRQLLKLGQELGLYLPKKIDIYAIAIEEANTFGEGCTPRISEAIPRAVGAIVVDLGLMVQ